MTESSRPTARRAMPSDVPSLSGSLARAFRDDPVHRWLFPEPATRVARNAVYFTLILRHVHLRHGEVWTAHGGAAGALWDPPGTWRVPATTVLRTAPALVRLLGGRLPVALAGLRRVEARHPRVPHWYLAVLGTDPAAQGRGLATAVLAPVLDRCDAEGVPAYLETATPENVPFYRARGFEVTGEVTLPRGPLLWLMTRPPAGGPGHASA